MNNKATKINEKGFYIWFDKNNKKEYYATPITLYRAKIVKNKDSKFSHIVFSENYLPKVTPKRNKPAVVKNALKLKSLDIHNPYEERIGMFLINFLNAETENWKVAYKTFFYAYNFSLLQNYSSKKQIKSEYEDETDFRRTAEEIYEASNDYGLADTDSTPGNKKTDEDDYSTANILLGVKTGQIFIYVTLTITSIAIIGIGIYMIKKKVLK